MNSLRFARTIIGIIMIYICLIEIDNGIGPDESLIYWIIGIMGGLYLIFASGK